MNKLIFSIVLMSFIFSILFAGKDTIKTSGKWSTLGWSLGSTPTSFDTVYKTIAGVNDTMEADYTISAFVERGVSGTHWQSGYGLNLIGNDSALVMLGTGSQHLGNYITINGASAIVVFGSALGAVTSASCSLAMNGTTGMKIINDKVLTFKTMVLGSGAKIVKIVGNINLSSKYPLYSINGGTITTSDGQINLNVSNMGNPWVILGATPIFGTDQYGLVISGSMAGDTVIIPTTSFSTVSLYIRSQYNNTVFLLSGNLNVSSGILRIYVSSANIKNEFNSNNYNISVPGVLRIGTTNATAVMVSNFGSSTIAVNAVDQVMYNSGIDTMNLQNSNWSIRDTWSCGSINNRGTSTIKFLNWKYDQGDHQVYQRVNDGIPGGLHGNAIFSGTTCVSSGDIKIQALSKIDSAIIKDWTVVKTGFTSGEYLCTLTSVPQGGWYWFKMMIGNDTLIGNNKWGIGDIFAVAPAQSNAGGGDALRGNSNDTANDLCGQYFVTRGRPATGTWKRLTDPPYIDIGGSTEMIKFSNSYISDRNIPIGIINCYIGGSSMYSETVSPVYHQWHYHSLDTQSYYGKFYNQVKYGANGKIRGVIGYQGENDAEDSMSSLVNNNYFNSICDVLGWMRSDLGYTVPYFITPLTRRINGSSKDNGWQKVRMDQIKMTKDSILCFISACPYPLLLMDGDSCHLSQQSVDTLGAWWYRGAIKPYLDGTLTNNSYPQIQRAIKINNSTIKLSLNSLTSTPPFTGIQITDSGFSEIFTQAVTGNDVYLTTSTRIGDSALVKYIYGANPIVTNPMYGAQGLPVAPFYGYATSPAKILNKRKIRFGFGMGF